MWYIYLHVQLAFVINLHCICFPNQTNLSAMQEDLLAVLESKNPSVKEETIRYLVRCFSKSTPAALPKPFLKPVCSSLLKVRAYKMFYLDLIKKYYLLMVVRIVHSQTDHYDW